MSRFVPAALAVWAGTAMGWQTPAPIAGLKTTPEATAFKATSTYDDVVRFMTAVDDASPVIHSITYGTTSERRAMPMAVVGTGLKDGSAASVKGTGKLRIHIQGNIHAGEVEGKESALVLLREFAAGQHADWLQSTVFLVTPIFNADGNEKFALTNRPRQNGPINGMGTRQNAQGLNINRDFMKLDTPEGRAFVKLWADYDPHVGIDLHTSNGSNHGYHLTYSPPLNPNTSDRIMKIQRDEWFPFITSNIKAKHGWDTSYYGNAGNPSGRGGRGRGPGPGDGAAAGQEAGRGRETAPPAAGQPPGPRAWQTFEHVPRFHNNYVGLRNRFALLSEAYSYATFEDRIKVTSYFLEEALTFAHRNAVRLAAAVAAADAEAIVGTAGSTRSRIKRGGTIDILMGEVEDEVNPNSGAVMNRRKNVVRTEPMIDMLWFEPSATEEVPAVFYVPAAATGVLDLLRAHGVRMAAVAEAVRGVEQFTITSNTARQPNGSIDTGTHGLRTIEGSWAPAPSAVVPTGSWAVAMKQPLGRLAFYLLAPTSDDGALAWNFLDDLITGGAPYPIARSR